MRQLARLATANWPQIQSRSSRWPVVDDVGDLRAVWRDADTVDELSRSADRFDDAVLASKHVPQNHCDLLWCVAPIDQKLSVGRPRRLNAGSKLFADQDRRC